MFLWKKERNEKLSNVPIQKLEIVTPNDTITSIIRRKPVRARETGYLSTKLRLFNGMEGDDMSQRRLNVAPKSLPKQAASFPG
jgi:hypothetical protein